MVMSVSTALAKHFQAESTKICFVEMPPNYFILKFPKTITYHAGQYCVSISLYYSNPPIAFCSLLPHCPLAAFLNGLHTSMSCALTNGVPLFMAQVPEYSDL